MRDRNGYVAEIVDGPTQACVLPQCLDIAHYVVGQSAYYMTPQSADHHISVAKPQVRAPLQNVLHSDPTQNASFVPLQSSGRL